VHANRELNKTAAEDIMKLVKVAAAQDRLEVQDIAAHLHWQKRGAKVTHELIVHQSRFLQ
jgi:hypothetical protein